MKRKIKPLINFIYHCLYTLGLWLIEINYLYKNPKLCLFCIKAWFFQWHYTHSKKYSKDCESTGLSKEELTYGETPISTLNKLLSSLKLSKDSQFLELGSGTGKTLYFIKKKFKIKTQGIEIIPGYQKWYQKQKLNIKTDNFFNHSFKNATILYISDTCLSKKTLSRLNEKLIL